MKKLILLTCGFLIYSCNSKNTPLFIVQHLTSKIIAEQSFELPLELQDRFSSSKIDTLKDALNTINPSAAFQIKTMRMISIKDSTSTFITKVAIELINGCKECTYQEDINSKLINMTPENSKGFNCMTLCSVIAAQKTKFTYSMNSRTFCAKSDSTILKL